MTVIREGHKNGKSGYWECECSCGNPNNVIIWASSLTSGSTKSCGCFSKEMISARFKKYNKYDLSGAAGIGYTSKNVAFYFDKEDYDKIKNYSRGIINA